MADEPSIDCQLRAGQASQEARDQFAATATEQLRAVERARTRLQDHPRLVDRFVDILVREH